MTTKEYLAVLFGLLLVLSSTLAHEERLQEVSSGADSGASGLDGPGGDPDDGELAVSARGLTKFAADARDAQIQVSGKEIQIECAVADAPRALMFLMHSSRTRDGDSKNRFEVRVKINEPKLEIELKSYANDKDSKEKSRVSRHPSRACSRWIWGLQFKWKIWKLVEFTDAGAPGYDTSDAVVKTWSFKESNWTISPPVTTAGIIVPLHLALRVIEDGLRRRLTRAAWTECS